MKAKIYAVDFDGTLFSDRYPDIGEPNIKLINKLKQLQQNGNTLILWTCRNGKDLKEAVDMCELYGLTFDYVNENTKENLEKYNKIDNRKIYADHYIDDKNLSISELLNCKF